MSDLKRSLASRLTEAETRFPLILLSGPRGSGKTCLARSLFEEGYNYVSLGSKGISSMARQHPLSFLELNSGKIILDDIDKAPELLTHIIRRIRTDPDRDKFILISSRNIFPARVFASLDHQLLAWFSLFPLTIPEMSGFRESAFPWEEAHQKNNPFMSGAFLWQTLLRGFYPEIAGRVDEDITRWHRNHLDEIIEEEIRFLRKKVPPDGIRELLRILAEKTGDTLNFSEIARGLGISLHILKTWVDLLEETYQIILVPPLVSGIRKPVIKSPKAYFTDTGLLCHVLGLTTADETQNCSCAERIFENLVVSEIYKRTFSRGEIPEICFWRKSTGMEVSLIIKYGSLLVPLEVSLSGHAGDKTDKGIRFFRKEFGQRTGTGYMINPGKYSIPLNRGIQALPFSNL